MINLPSVPEGPIYEYRRPEAENSINPAIPDLDRFADFSKNLYVLHTYGLLHMYGPPHDQSPAAHCPSMTVSASSSSSPP